jgi:hypothetical protein
VCFAEEAERKATVTMKVALFVASAMFLVAMSTAMKDAPKDDTTKYVAATQKQADDANALAKSGKTNQQREDDMDAKIGTSKAALDEKLKKKCNPAGAGNKLTKPQKEALLAGKNNCDLCRKDETADKKTNAPAEKQRASCIFKDAADTDTPVLATEADCKGMYNTKGFKCKWKKASEAAAVGAHQVEQIEKASNALKGITGDNSTEDRDNIKARLLASAERTAKSRNYTIGSHKVLMQKIKKTKTTSKELRTVNENVYGEEPNAPAEELLIKGNGEKIEVGDFNFDLLAASIRRKSADVELLSQTLRFFLQRVAILGESMKPLLDLKKQEIQEKNGTVTITTGAVTEEIGDPATTYEVVFNKQIAMLNALREKQNDLMIALNRSATALNKPMSKLFGENKLQKTVDAIRIYSKKCIGGEMFLMDATEDRGIDKEQLQGGIVSRIKSVARSECGEEDLSETIQKFTAYKVEVQEAKTDVIQINNVAMDIGKSFGALNGVQDYLKRLGVFDSTMGTVAETDAKTGELVDKATVKKSSTGDGKVEINAKPGGQRFRGSASLKTSARVGAAAQLQMLGLRIDDTIANVKKARHKVMKMLAEGEKPSAMHFPTVTYSAFLEQQSATQRTSKKTALRGLRNNGNNVGEVVSAHTGPKVDQDKFVSKDTSAVSKGQKAGETTRSAAETQIHAVGTVGRAVKSIAENTTNVTNTQRAEGSTVHRTTVAQNNTMSAPSGKGSKTGAEIVNLMDTLKQLQTSFDMDVDKKINDDLAKPRATGKLTPQEINELIKMNKADETVAVIDKRLTWLRSALHSISGYYIWASAELKRGYQISTTTTTITSETANIVQDTLKQGMGNEKELLDMIMAQIDQLSPLADAVKVVTDPIKQSINTLTANKEATKASLKSMFEYSQNVMYDALFCGPGMDGKDADGEDLKTLVAPANDVMKEPETWKKQGSPFPFISEIVNKCKNEDAVRSFCKKYKTGVTRCADAEACKKQGADANKAVAQAFSETFEDKKVREDDSLKDETPLAGADLKCPNYITAKLEKIGLRPLLGDVAAIMIALLSEFKAALQ